MPKIPLAAQLTGSWTSCRHLGVPRYRNRPRAIVSESSHTLTYLELVPFRVVKRHSVFVIPSSVCVGLSKKSIYLYEMLGIVEKSLQTRPSNHVCQLRNTYHDTSPDYPRRSTKHVTKHRSPQSHLLYLFLYTSQCRYNSLNRI